MNAARVRELLSDPQMMTSADWQSVYDWLNYIQDKEEAYNMPMPGPVEACALAHCHKMFELWVKHIAGTSVIHSQTPDLRSFQAGYLTALMEVEHVQQQKEDEKS